MSIKSMRIFFEHFLVKSELSSIKKIASISTGNCDERGENRGRPHRYGIINN